MHEHNFEKEDVARAYLAAIIESSDDAIISKGLDGIITSWNRSAEKLFGYSAEEAIGKHITLIIPSDRQDEEHIIIGKVKAGQKVDHFETVRKAKNGRLIDLSITVSPIRNGEGSIIGASKVARDITELRKTEQSLIEASRKRDDFLASISHELRTPMTAIMGLANILGRSKNLDEKEKRYVNILNQSAEDMMALVNDLLDFSRLEAGRVELEEVEFNLSEIIDRTEQTFKVTAAQKGLTLETVYTDVLREYYFGDPLRLQQIFNNLVGNAVKFTEEGSVTLKISGQEKNNMTEFTLNVVDTGIGISEKNFQTIFDKFAQADSSITRKYGGSGLGLAITKTLVEKMGGKIDVQSKVALGSVFTLTLPLRHTVNKTLIPQVAQSSKNKKKNVLIVEDYEPNAVVLSAMLDLLNYTYDEAKNGLQALRRYHEVQYDVILMDIQMEEMDGLESARRIREYEKENDLSETPIIAMTAHVHEKDKSKCFEVGMNDFISKPLGPGILEEKLSDLIGL